MASVIVALILVVLAYFAVVLFKQRQDEVSAPPAVRDPAGRLLALSGALTAIGDASSHPRDLAGNATFTEAVQILAEGSPIETVTDFATGANWMLSAVACAALVNRADGASAAEAMHRHFRHMSPWPMFYALKFFVGLEQRPPLGSLVLHGPEYWTQHPLVAGLLAEHFVARADLGDEVGFGDALKDVSTEELDQAEVLLRRINHPAAKVLLDECTAWRRRTLDREFLLTVGRFVDPQAETQLLVEHGSIKEQLAAAEAFVVHEPYRSALIVGEPRVGKTSFAMLLAGRLAAQGWSMFEAGAASVMAGQQYIGQLEERVRRLVKDLAAEKRVIWYVPDFAQFASSGTHRAQTASLLDQVLPAITAGRIIVLSETSASALTVALQQRPALRTAVELVRLGTPTEAESLKLAHDVAARVAPIAGVEIDAEVTDTALHVTRHYLGSDQLPGAALDLIKLTAQRIAAHDGSRMQRDDVLTTLSQLTGMPRLVLDDSERVDLANVRQFFSQRVIGQAEAVDIVVDRIAMLKAGLTDPSKPIAVFLFAGPTGTGKTELAKTLAEFLFGSADRLLRLDMSEFQTADSTTKILGEANSHGEGLALTHRVRKQPFSVVLLDEFEKAHPNAWDLFLQVFDDGRLTDATGQTVDFRHCIIVLTSNVGSKIQQQAGPGFAGTTGAFSQEHVLRAVDQSFRPEFINRLDAIIVFRPLTRELMRGILAKELARVLERRGLRAREWAFELESSALEFLLDKGFSPTMGARPLKRAIDRYLLAPLAATLVEHRFPEGDQFLFVRSDGRAIQVEFVDPDAPADTAPPLEAESVQPGGPTLPRMMLQPSGRDDERVAVVSERRRMEGIVNDGPWAALEARLTMEMQQTDFWSRAERFDVLARYASIDRVKAALGTARALEGRLDRSSGRSSKDLVSRLAAQLYLVQHGIDDVRLNAAVEVVMTIVPVLDAGADAAAASEWAGRVTGMYRRWADRRHMQWEDVAGVAAGPGLIVVSGFGASRILNAECGLHILEYEVPGQAPSRAVVRVRVAPTPATLPEAAAARYAALSAELSKARDVVSVVRRYRLDASPLVRDVARGWRTGRHELVLDGNFDVLGDLFGAAV